MRRRRPFLDHAPAQDRSTLDPIVRLWMLRILVPMGGLRRLVHDACGLSPDVQMRFGMDPDDIDDTATLELQIRQASIPLKKLHAQAERNAHKAQLPDALVANIARLASLVHLTPTESRILEFACLLHTVSELDDMADALGQLTTAKAQEALEQLLRLPGAEVKAALSPQGQLARCGLLTMCGHRDTLNRPVFRGGQLV